MYSVDIVLHINPPTTTAQSASRIFRSRDGRLFIGKNRRSGRFATEWNTIEHQLTIHAPTQPFVGAVHISVNIIYPWRSGESLKVRAQGEIPKTTKPDLDNLAKYLLDLMQRHGYYENDSQICELHLSKFWGDDPCIKISIKNYEKTVDSLTIQ